MKIINQAARLLIVALSLLICISCKSKESIDEKTEQGSFTKSMVQTSADESDSTAVLLEIEDEKVQNTNEAVIQDSGAVSSRISELAETKISDISSITQSGSEQTDMTQVTTSTVNTTSDGRWVEADY